MSELTGIYKAIAYNHVIPVSKPKYTHDEVRTDTKIKRLNGRSTIERIKNIVAIQSFLDGKHAGDLSDGQFSNVLELLDEELNSLHKLLGEDDE